jgi:hypothetical protein
LGALENIFRVRRKYFALGEIVVFIISVIALLKQLVIIIKPLVHFQSERSFKALESERHQSYIK